MKCIVVGANGSGDVTVEGDPNVDTQVRIETRKGFTGRLMLENAWLTGIKNKPCIDIGEDNDVTLVLTGENKLDLGGIRVPESSRLTVRGEGRLEIHLDSNEYYGIGNGIGLLHGELIFDQSGRITVNAHGQTGVAIGSGSGGIIRILQGQYRLNLQGDVGLGIGSMYSECDLVMHDCDLGMEMTLARGAAIGSIGRSSNLEIYKTSAKLFLSGVELVGIGTVGGETCSLNFHDSSCILNMKGERCACFAALEGSTDVQIMRASVRLNVSGKEALGIGGFTGDTDLNQDTADVHINLDTPLPVREYVSRERFCAKDGTFSFTHNGNVLFSGET